MSVARRWMEEEDKYLDELIELNPAITVGEIVSMFRNKFPERTEHAVEQRVSSKRQVTRIRARAATSTMPPPYPRAKPPARTPAWEVAAKVCDLLSTLPTVDDQRRAISAAATLLGIYEETT